MKISLIAALTKNRVIGRDGKMPWHFSEDLKYFKRTTLNKPIIMGRKTFESIHLKPLPKRKNIVITSNKSLFKNIDNVIVVDNIEAAIAACSDAEEVMVIGGAKIYQQFLPKADRLYLTFIHEEYTGDTYFPEYKKVKNWHTITKEKYNDFTTVVLENHEI